MGSGNSTSKPVANLIINNPVFNQAKLITKDGQRRIQIEVATDEKNYKKFVELQEQKIYPELLMIPLHW